MSRRPPSAALVLCLACACASSRPSVRVGGPADAAPPEARPRATESALGDHRDLEGALLALVNRDRHAAGRPALVWDRKLAAIARSHSEDMVAEGYVGHDSPRFGGLGARLDRAGYLRHMARENVGRADDVETVELGFMHSPGHRANLLAPDVTHVGIGIVRAPDPEGNAMLWVTQVFAAPVPPLDPKRIRTAYMTRVEAARRAKGLGTLPVDPALDRVARRFAADQDGRVDEAMASRLGDLAVQALASAGRTDVRGVDVIRQQVLSEDDLKVAHVLVGGARSYAVVAVLTRDDRGRTRVEVFTLVGI